MPCEHADTRNVRRESFSQAGQQPLAFRLRYGNVLNPVGRVSQECEGKSASAAATYLVDATLQVFQPCVSLWASRISVGLSQQLPSRKREIMLTCSFCLSASSVRSCAWVHRGPSWVGGSEPGSRERGMRHLPLHTYVLQSLDVSIRVLWSVRERWLVVGASLGPEALGSYKSKCQRRRTCFSLSTSALSVRIVSFRDDCWFCNNST